MAEGDGWGEVEADVDTSGGSVRHRGRFCEGQHLCEDPLWFCDVFQEVVTVIVAVTSCMQNLLRESTNNAHEHRPSDHGTARL